MKTDNRHLTAIVLFAAVFIVGLVFMPKSFVFQHDLGLFLFLPDYFRDVFSGSFPISTLIGNFLVQFYKFPVVGPLCTALIITSIYLLARGIFKKITRFSTIVAVAIACIAWLFVATSTTPIIGVATLLITAILRIASIPLKSLTKKAEPLSQTPAMILIAAMAVFIISGKVTRNIETWSRIEVAAKRGKWDDVLKAASPEKAAKDRDMVPFALLAAGEKGSLQAALSKYNVANPGEMDFTGVENRRAFFFESILNERMGCINEAIHNIYQCSCHMHWGLSFSTLTQLIRYNIELGDYTLVRKYCHVLEKSPAYNGLAKKLLKMYEGLDDAVLDNGPSELAPVTTNNPMYDIATMAQCGIESRLTQDRYSAYALLLSRYHSGNSK